MQLNIYDYLNQTKINPNLKYTYDSVQNPIYAQISPSVNNLKDEFISTKKKQSFTEKIANFAKNVTGLGVGSKKVEAALSDANITEENAKSIIKQYQISQKSARQNIGNIAAGGAGLAAFYGIQKGSKYLDSALELKIINGEKICESVNQAKNNLSKKFKIVEKINPESILKFARSKKGAAIIGAASAFLLSGFAKYNLLEIDKFGSGKYKLDKEKAKTMSKEEKKEAKKSLKKERNKERFSNFITGGITGMAAPLASLLGVAGIPLYGASSIGLNYLSTKDEDTKLTDVVKNSAFSTIISMAAVSAMMLKGRGSYNVFAKNMDEVVENLKKANLKPMENSGKTSYEELREILYDAPEIKSILSDYKTDTSQKINDLTNENIFAVKFKQIENGSGGLSTALKENCPATRTLDEAQGAINKLLGNEDYQVTKLLGVGTVAESYLAKGKDGKEVCIKILKDGINREKILADKEKFVQLITKGAATEQLNENQKYLLRNIDNLADGILKEVDFKNEMQAAKELKKYTKLANVVAPIEAKDGIYIMEKAPGISLDSFAKYYELDVNKKMYEKEIAKTGSEYYKGRLKDIEKDIAELKAKTPDFEDFDLSNKEIESLLKNYIDVYTEQFNKIDGNGKILHADIHPGNIFIDIDALKSGKGKPFTLIDTGNTINISKEQAQRSLRLTNFVKNGNTKDIAAYVTENAILPEGMTQGDAVKKVEEGLQKAFFDHETELPNMTNESIITLTDNIMRKNGIIANDSQLNLKKARDSAQNSLGYLSETFFDKKYANMNADSKQEQIKAGAAIAKDMASIGGKSIMATKIQELKNLSGMSPREILKQIKNPNMNKTSSKEYLTYKLKQLMPKAEGETSFFS